jgi:hydrogenase maturation protein HypF
VIEYVRLPGGRLKLINAVSSGKVHMDKTDKKNSYKIEIRGIVQGVGFRPFIYRLARTLGIKGTVANTTEGVVVSTAGLSDRDLQGFTDAILKQSPPASKIEDIRTIIVQDKASYSGFSIEKSRDTGKRFQLVSPDLATCESCRKDILDPHDKRRYHYPFTNCTNCGPRFTIIKRMPYDRPHTTMDRFRMCPDCEKEYSDPLDRRFHAQPNACSACGPRLVLVDSNGKAIESDEPLKDASALLGDGKIIGLKSLGGFQIACNALSDEAVNSLRSRKSRPAKPFAIMAANTGWIEKYYHIDSLEGSLLRSPRAPIVLLRKKPGDYPLSCQVSPGNKYEGIMLPYTPIHHILFEYFGTPLVMTSGNISEEPIASENNDAYGRLKNICDYYLMHDRDIFSRYDDSVVRAFRGREMVLRRARGYAPYPLKLDIEPVEKDILASGAQEKNTFTMLTKNYGITSQHIGDLDTAPSIDFYRSSLKNYQNIFGIDHFGIIAHDMHPDYRSTRDSEALAGKTEMLFPVQHHKAHIASVIAENHIHSHLLGFSWDGTGYGEDGKIWGSEVFSVNRSLDFQRIGHLSEKILPGGDITIKRPYRMAAAYLYYMFRDDDRTAAHILDNMTYGKIQKQELDILTGQLETGFNSPATTSMGRFFDAVSSHLDLKHVISYEGEAAIALEMAIDDSYADFLDKAGLSFIDENYRYDIRFLQQDDSFIIDDMHIFRQLFEDKASGADKGLISFRFHNTLAQVITDVSCRHRDKTGTRTIALSGGVFQNRYLLDLCYTLLNNNGFEVYTNLKVPVNDGGISLGQAYMALNFKNNIRRN